MRSHITLPDAPASAWINGVAVWTEDLVIDTYTPEDPDRFPAFLDRRVYQGSSGKVYPLPFHERISSDKEPVAWKAVHLENAWMRLVILPELGGRIHIAYDKVAGYDIFYRNNVIKPALVGLAGPWISGGIEFNWPQHHRPATYLPTDVAIERDPSGAVTVWCSDHDPFARMKGMHGIQLSPDSSRIDVHARLYNRSETTQTFLWWANVAAAVNDDYQSFFPTDVTRVADHAKRAVVDFPHPDAPYYGVDYAARITAEQPDADRLDWYRNIPVPTSYMALDSTDNFFGGYDHGVNAGFVHVAAHEVAPGKKQWTWGNAPFGWAWDRNLTDTEGPYVELMAGVFTDNQPDFAFLAAGETKTFTQSWYPIRQIGPVRYADDRLALAATPIDGALRIGITACDTIGTATLAVRDTNGTPQQTRQIHLDPAVTVIEEFPGALLPNTAIITITTERGDTVLTLDPTVERTDAAVETHRAVEPAHPGDVATIDELIHIATYLDQYRHATRSATPYLEEALRRDAGETRALLALGQKAYQRADYVAAADFLASVIRRTTQWTSTPASGDAHYWLGLTLTRLGRLAEAATVLGRAMWDSRYAVAARFALARIRSRQQLHGAAEALLQDALSFDPNHLQSANLLATIHLEQGDTASANQLAAATLLTDPLDAWARHLLGEQPTQDPTIMLDVALEYGAAGFLDRADEALTAADRLLPKLVPGQVNVAPLIALHRASIALRRDDMAGADTAVATAEARGYRSAHPSRLDDIDALIAVDNVMTSPLPAALLGHWYYDHGRYDDATAAWSRALGRGADTDLAAVLHRNLGLAAYNVASNPIAAHAHFRTAVDLDPNSAKLRFELDQLEARIGTSAENRLSALEERRDLVDTRDDLTIAFVHLLVDVGRVDEAQFILERRHFQPWEGGEGQALGAWDRTGLTIGQQLLQQHRPDTAVGVLRDLLTPPPSLGEDRHLLANTAEIHLTLGDALAATGDHAAAVREWEQAATATGDFIAMAPTPYSTSTVFAAYALHRLGREAEATDLLAAMATWLDEYAVSKVEVDFFATSLPSMLLFVEQPEAARDRAVVTMRRQLEQWRRDTAADRTETGATV